MGSRTLGRTCLDSAPERSCAVDGGGALQSARFYKITLFLSYQKQCLKCCLEILRRGPTAGADHEQ